jgi:hypothetical protein
MKAKSAVSCYIDDSTRCQQRTASGRRCKLPVESAGKLLCFMHTREMLRADTLNLKAALLTGHQGFQTAQGINNSLRNLYILLANNYISPRRAAVLAFINSLQLRTLPAIDADNEAGITDPTAPQPQQAPVTDEEASPELAADSDPEGEAESNSELDPNSELESGPLETNAKHSASVPSDAPASPDPAPPSKYRSYWDTIPDPTKKPS